MILLIANILFALSWAFAFSSARKYHLTLRKLPVGIVLARAHQHSLSFGNENIHHELVKVKASGSAAAMSCRRGCIQMLRWGCQQSATCPLSSPLCPVLGSLSGKSLPVYWQKWPSATLNEDSASLARLMERNYFPKTSRKIPGLNSHMGFDHVEVLVT